MNPFSRKTHTDDFLPSVTTLMSGTTLAMAIAYLARPLLTRLYTPEMFGLLGFFAAIVALLSTVSAGRYDDAVMLPKKDQHAKAVLYVGGLILIGLTILTLPVAYFSSYVAEAVGKSELGPFLVVLPISVFASGLIRLADSWLTRKKRFRTIAFSRASQNSIAVPIQVSVGLSNPSPWGLIGGLVAGQTAAALVIVVATARDLRDTVRPTLASMRDMASRYKDFPFFSGPSALLNTSSTQLPAILLFFFFDASVVGHYAQSYALLAVPIGLVGSSVAQVYFVKAAQSKLDGGLDLLTERVYRRLLELGLFPMMAILIAGPEIIEFILGADWRLAGSYAQWLSVWLLLVFITSPLTRLFDVLEKLRANLMFNVLLFMTRAIALIVGGLSGSALVAIAMYGVCSAALYLGLLTWLLGSAGVSLSTAFNHFGRAAAIVLLPLGVVGFAVYWGAQPVVIVVVTCVCAAAYFAVVLFGGKRSRET